MGQVLDPSRSLGMTGRLGWRWGVSAMYWQSWAIPPLDPSTLLPPRRILQRRMFHLRQGERPLPGMDSGSRGAEMQGWERIREWKSMQIGNASL